MINESSTPQPVIRPIETEIKAKLQNMTVEQAEKAGQKGYTMVLMSNYISEAYRDKFLTPAEVKNIKI